MNNYIWKTTHNILSLLWVVFAIIYLEKIDFFNIIMNQISDRPKITCEVPAIWGRPAKSLLNTSNIPRATKVEIKDNKPIL